LPRSEMLELPEAPDRRTLSDEPSNAEAAPGAFSYLLTPADQRFVRCHYPIPALDDAHVLEITGAISTPLRLSLEALRALPVETQTVVTECAGNGRANFLPPIAGEQWGDGAVSVAQWTGVPLAAVLEQAGLRDTAVELVFTGADGGAYQRSLPREAAASALLAVQMNGAPIAPQFGGPLRLVMPGWYGMASVKWLARIEAVEAPFTGPYQTEKYLYAPGAPVTKMRIKSMFTAVPRDLRSGVPARLEGLAWGGDRVDRVEVSVGGAWREATLTGPALPNAWRRFRFRWTPLSAGDYVLRCRATDVRGETQPDAPVRNAGGYGANGIQRLSIRVS
jgi:DMSO/TMAO reductase YedYZ molybdopterin-dependent catalytic subunit